MGVARSQGYLSPWTSLTDGLNDDETRRIMVTNESRVVLVAVDGPDIRGIGEFTIDQSTHEAEIALVVEDAFQSRGIGLRMYRALERLACQRGVSSFTGDVHVANGKVLAMLRGIGRPLRTQVEFGSVRFVLSLVLWLTAPEAGRLTARPVQLTAGHRRSRRHG
jgi:GNAT superfamily N-acetyltransferase